MLREKIIEIGKTLNNTGLVAGTWGNISAWDSEYNGYWITPSGMDYQTLQEKDLVLLDLEGNVLIGKRKPSSEYLLHREVYIGRPDIKGVVHTHSPYASAHAVSRVSLPAIVEDLAMLVGGNVEVADYYLPGTQELAQRTVEKLGRRNAVLLANHGLVGVGKSVEEALKVCQVVEKGAQIHIMSRVLGNTTVLDEQDVAAMADNYLTKYGQP
ncbi:MAG: class II aldolase/adducin family protein [Desulfitobacterium sp.]|nr:class II aldolase/adducin family protein [Desulfitobacterium sp.]